MKKRKALITGINGQDGSYLSEYLLDKGYEIYGIIRRNSFTENQSTRIDHILPKLNIFYSDLLDFSSLGNLVNKIKPDEIYNLAAQSHVKVSFETPIYTSEVNAIGTLNLLEAIRSFSPMSKFYQASSSEMFGSSVDDDGYQRETTNMNPVSPYGCSKVFAFNITRNYREAYKLFTVNGILFNHESPKRGVNFVTNKVVKNAVLIKLGRKNKLELGNLDSYRDWGHSKDYVKAMHKMINHHQPDDYVVATGQTHSVREMTEYVFNKLNLNYKDYVKVNPKYFRPQELSYLKGDPSKIKREIGWEPEYSFENMLDEMIDYWIKKLDG